MSLLERSAQSLLARRVLPERESAPAAAASPAEPPAFLPEPFAAPEPPARPAGLSALLSDELEREDRRYSKPLTI